MSEAVWGAIALLGYAGLSALGFCYLRLRCRVGRRLQLAFACACAALLALGLWLYPPTRGRAGHWLMLPLLATIAAEDLAARRISNKLLLAMLALGVLMALADAGARLNRLAAPLIYGAIFAALSLASRGGLGMGDAKLIAVVSVYYGIIGMFTVLFAASIAACLGSVAVLIRTKNLRSEIPFAPAILLGAIAALFWVV